MKMRAPSSHKTFTYIHRAVRSGGCITPLHAVLPNIHSPRFIPELLSSDKSSHARPDGQTSRPGGHKWPITAGTLLWSTATTPKQPKLLCFTERQELAWRLRAEHESKFHDLSGALGKGLVENPLVVS